MKKSNYVLKSMLAGVMTLSVLSGGLTQVNAANLPTYNLHPNPQKIVYQNTMSKLKDVNLVLEKSIDHVTKMKIEKILKEHDLKYQVSQKIIKDKTNVLLGTHDSNGFVDQYYDDINDKLFEKKDSHYLEVDNDVIGILGDDSDSVYYCLGTLDEIFDQSANKTVRNLSIEDYADSKLRGFIEGYYGIPWSHQDRQSLMEFGGQFKMNTYIFAPKDDPYHNQKWRELYPEKELNMLKELVNKGKETKVEFTWAIHPLMNDAINFKDEEKYQKDLKDVENKLEQLYSIGVRQFGISADDISGSFNPEHHRRLLTDVYKWLQTKKDKTELIFVPTIYNTGFLTWGKGYLTTLTKDLPKDIHIMWTGEVVLGRVEQKTIDKFKELTEHNNDGGFNPFFWLNWPVNDLNNKRLIMSPATVVDNNVTHLDGVVTNPMQQAEASKISLFSIADYAWNTQDFDSDKSWSDSFKYIDTNASEELKEIAKHLCDPSSEFQVLPESEEFVGIFKEFDRCLKEGKDISKVADLLIQKYQTINQSVDNFKVKANNKKLLSEMEPWLNSLRDISESSIQFLNIYKKLEAGNVDESIWDDFKIANNILARSATYVVHNLKGDDIVESGTKRLLPFVNKMASDLNNKVFASVEALEKEGHQVFNPAYTELMYLIKNPISLDACLKNVDNNSNQYLEIKSIYEKYQNSLSEANDLIYQDAPKEKVKEQINIIRGYQKEIIASLSQPKLTDQGSKSNGDLKNIYDKNDNTYVWYDKINNIDTVMNFDFGNKLSFKSMNINAYKWNPMPENVHIEYLKDGQWVEACVIEQLLVGNNTITFDKPIETSQMRIHLKPGENNKAEDILIKEVSFEKENIKIEAHPITKEWMTKFKSLDTNKYTPKSLELLNLSIKDLSIFDSLIDKNENLKNELITKIQKNYQNLNLSGDKNTVAKKIVELKQIDKSKYTKESYANIEVAIRNLEKIMDESYTATVKQVNNAIEYANNAISLLVKQPHLDDNKDKVSKGQIDQSKVPNNQVNQDKTSNSQSNHKRTDDNITTSKKPVNTSDQTSIYLIAGLSLTSLLVGFILLFKIKKES